MEQIVGNFFDGVDFNSAKQCKRNYEDCVTCLSQGYWDSEGIDYSCENKRTLYVVRYLPVHVREVMDALHMIPTEKQKNWFKLKQLNVVCLGGGPGTDNLAFNKWLKSKRLFHKGKITKVKILRIDRCSEWDDISPKINNEYFPNDITLDRVKNNHDVTKHALKVKDKANLIIMSYLISEIDNKKIEFLANNIKNISEKGAVIVINDRNQKEVNKKISKLYDFLGVKSLDSNREQCHCGINFSDDISTKAKPKFMTSAIKYCGVL